MPLNPYSHPSVLIIDDVPEIRQSIAACLNREGYRTVCAADGKEGLKIMASTPLDLVLTDILMEQKGGLEIILEARQKQPAPPVIAMSGGGYMMDRDCCLKTAKDFGAAATIQKPFTRQELMDAVGQVCAQEQA